MSRPVIALLASCLVVLPAATLAQFKVVGPDGRVTYTDRPPADASAKVTRVGPGAGTAPPAAAGRVSLPPDLQRLVDRFPVTLFTGASCAPCDTGRQMLVERGVPYTERVVASADDIAALERTVGGRTLPALTVGGQALRGFSQTDWTSYLDAAGYPRQSQLPSGWSAPQPAPLVARAQAVAAPPAPEPPPARQEAPPPAAPASGAIRF